ncbi:hypothetical protein HNR06_000969 [Nocardiopsis arvandica]|uniref:UDP-N-acetylglucosamine--peptide N-acetylglucosaminyltransferase SPINDLY n=1 Tax=Nocardiopsis sinuspersici TaxID=501010 RepID=A0A7Y9XBS4_9ACTN|nr:hypothetical protein [Nocardiopsis sinuspersici]
MNNRVGDVHGTAAQFGPVHGPVTVHSTPTPTASSVPGWVKVALPIHQADARDLGAHEALPDTEGQDLPPYVPREIDGELDRRLTTAATSPRGGIVLVAGASTAGKTRALAAALARTLPERMLVTPPEDADLRSLPAWLEERAAQAPHGWVVWLDDLDRHLSSSGLTPTLVAELGHAGAVVAATIRSERLKDLRPSATDHGSALEGVGYAVLKTPPVTVRREWSPQERERARATGDRRLVRAAADERFGVAEQLAAGPLLQQAWRDGPDCGHPRGYALVAAAVGLAQAGASRPLTRDQLQSAHTLYLPTPPPLPEEADQAWEWATRQRSGMAGLLVPADHEGTRWRVFDYLTPPGPLSEAVWHAALAAATARDRFTIGVTAYRAAQIDVAETAWRALAHQGRTSAMSNLGVLLKGSDRVEEAETWYRKAADHGHPDAMSNLGVLLKGSDRVEEAETWYRKAADHGHPDAMYNLGVLLKGSDRVEEAETWYRKAADHDHTGAMYNLGNLLADAGRTEEAETWYRKAADHDHTGAMYNLGNLLADAGRTEEAETWYRKAADHDHTGAMSNLGNLLVEAGQVQEAEDLYRQAAELGHTDAMYNLGVLLTDTGRAEEAEDWYRKAADHGHPDAMYNLSNLLVDAGRVEEAAEWRQRTREAEGAE